MFWRQLFYPGWKAYLVHIRMKAPCSSTKIVRKSTKNDWLWGKGRHCGCWQQEVPWGVGDEKGEQGRIEVYEASRQATGKKVQPGSLWPSGSGFLLIRLWFPGREGPFRLPLISLTELSASSQTLKVEAAATTTTCLSTVVLFWSTAGEHSGQLGTDLRKLCKVKGPKSKVWGSETFREHVNPLLFSCPYRTGTYMDLNYPVKIQ